MDRRKRIIITLISVFGVIIIGLLIAMRFVNYRELINKIFRSNDWIITQFGQRETNLMFYTIRNEKQDIFIVVDGGWREDAEYVRNIINVDGNGKVDAWIITHPHMDHAGAFCEIYKDLQGIRIEKVLAVDYPSPEQILSAFEWEDVEYLREFNSFDIPNLTYVYAGDIYNFGTLKIEILNPFKDHPDMYIIERDMNNPSMMFRVYGKKESFLFCGEAGADTSDIFADYYGDKLKSDYVQLSHHGNFGLNEAFYDLVNPKIALFDSPAFMMNDTSGKFNSPDKKLYFENMGSKCLSFETAPNVIYLK